MLAAALVWWCVGVGVGAHQWDASADYAAAGHGRHDVDFDDYYDEEDITSTTMTLMEPRNHTRVRRFGDQPSVVRTLSENEIKEVKGVLKEILSGRRVFNSTSTLAMETATRLVTVMLRATRSPSFTGLTRSHRPATRSSVDPTKFYENIIEEIIDHARKQGGDAAATKTTERETTFNGFLENVEISEPMFQSENTTDGETETPTARLNYEKTTTTEINWNEETTITQDSRNITVESTTPRRTRRTRRRTTTTTPPKEVIDIETLVEIIANLTLDYELINITDLFNKTLLKYNVPKCLAPETTTVSSTPPSTEEPMYDLVNATIISKCFVCGLENYGIPLNAYCADAFAGDFLPLVPVDPRAKGQIARYRKYCRYLDIPGVLQNETQPRSVYGRWTGGCSVRWIDLSGVYTQRACRNRRRAVMGNHFVSKRMAKLEMALNKEDNGCLISPMSSLVPLSRGISLYARFHACVCTGNWCNSAPDQSIPAISIVPWVMITLTWK